MSQLPLSQCFFLAKPNLQTHLQLLTSQQTEYLEALKSIRETGVVANLSQPTKARVLAALHMTRQHKTVDQFLQHCDVVEITKAAQILDRPRLIKQLERRIAEIEQAYPHLKEDEQEAKAKRDGKKHHRIKINERRTRSVKWSTTEMGKPSPDQKKKRRGRIDVYRSKLKHQKILMKEMYVSHDQQPALSAAAPGIATHQNINTALVEMVSSASLSGAFARKVRHFAKGIHVDFLELILISGAVSYWKILADLIHFKPSDFALPFFLSAVHGGELPEGSFVKAMKLLADVPDEDLLEHFNALAKTHPERLFQAFNFLRTEPRLLRHAPIADSLASHIPLATAIWYLEELAQSSNQVPAIVRRRLQEESWMDKSSKVTDSFGKLLERILTFRSRGWDLADDLIPAAETRLGALKETWAANEDNDKESLTVIFGDKSSSMESAIQAATIMAAMISTCFCGELSFFDHDFHKSPHEKPSTVKDVVNICRQIRASGATSLAAALWQYYVQRRKIDRIILVTDEEENTACNGYMFAQLLRRYKDEVIKDVELVIICVNKGDTAFRSSLERYGIDCRRIEIDGNRPDLSKFDSMLGQIALLSKKNRNHQNSSSNGPTSVEAALATMALEEEKGETMEEDFVVLDQEETVVDGL